VPAVVDASVVVPTRNRASFLPDCLRSLTAQRSAATFEIVVVDNGSNDGTADLVRAWSRRDGRVRLVEQPEIGLSRAKNAGIRSATGELLLFTDDDVVVSDVWLAAYVDFFSRPLGQPALAGGPVLPLPEDLSSWPPWVDEDAFADLPNLYYGGAERLLRDMEWIWGANMATRRSVFDELGGFDETIGRSGDHVGTYEDVEFVDRVRAARGEVWYFPRAAVYHRVRRSAAQPRALLLTAFTRGGNAFLAARRNRYFERSCTVPQSPVAAVLALPLMLSACAVSAAAFRLTRRRKALELARRSAWGAGWCMWASLGDSTRRPARAVRRLVLLGRQVALRLLPF
jgi:GT2 family glycosyltransferase